MRVWNTMSKNKGEITVVVILILLAGIIAIVKPINADTFGYFADALNILLIGFLMLLVLVGARRRVV